MKCRFLNGQLNIFVRQINGHGCASVVNTLMLRLLVVSMNQPGVLMSFRERERERNRAQYLTLHVHHLIFSLTILVNIAFSALVILREKSMC